MVKRMLIDATHAEETRVVVVNGTRLEEFDVETSTKKQLKGNIYLAKIVRVEPSLQAAFVEYGGGRHGFLAFNEIHPDYYQIPVADRKALIAAQRESLNQSASAAADFGDGDGDLDTYIESEVAPPVAAGMASQPDLSDSEGSDADGGDSDAHDSGAGEVDARDVDTGPLAVSVDQRSFSEPFADETADGTVDLPSIDVVNAAADVSQDESAPSDSLADSSSPSSYADSPPVPSNGDDAEEPERRPYRNVRHYKIQEVIKRRQIVLIQVVKEERGNKGAALTTFLSLAGRYCVLMPNTARGGGVSRKITNAADRKRLKSMVNELDIPETMAVIVRTAGSERTKPEIKRDYEYLLRLWDSVRDLTLQSTAPTLVYEEANLIKRSIRDLYSRDIEEVLVEGEEGYRLAKDFMRMLTPSHARKVQLFRDPTVPLFHKFQVEAQLDAMHSPVVQLRSGGYLVINQTEALVAIDVNSGRATKERHIEETAFKTNCEAADEVARQLRLRDLAGLIVIDFIDMEETRNNHTVERRLKEAMRFDRARIQLGRISGFGLLELSRQRLRPSLMETSFQPCVHCNGTGIVRSTESASVHILRAIEDEGVRLRSREVTVTAHPSIALYILNQKRGNLAEIERRYGFRVFILGDDGLVPPAFRMDRVKSDVALEAPPLRPLPVEEPEPDIIDEEDEVAAEPAAELAMAPDAEAVTDESEAARKRRRRRRRGRRDEASPSDASANAAITAEPRDEESAESAEGEEGEEEGSEESAAKMVDGVLVEGDPSPRRRRRGRRGGRRRNRRPDGTVDLGDVAAEVGGGPSDSAGADAGEPASVMSELLNTSESGGHAGDVAAEPLREIADTGAPASSAGEPGILPAPKARRPRKRAASASAAAPSDAPLPSASGAAASGPESDAPATDLPVKPSRRRKKPEASAETTAVAVAEMPVADVPPSRPASPVTQEAAEPFVSTRGTATEEPAAQGPSVGAPVPLDSPPVAMPVSSAPPRKGWWNRLMS